MSRLEVSILALISAAVTYLGHNYLHSVYGAGAIETVGAVLSGLVAVGVLLNSIGYSEEMIDGQVILLAVVAAVATYIVHYGAHSYTINEPSAIPTVGFVVGIFALVGVLINSEVYGVVDAV
jgi:hypothetical protein